MLFLPDSLRPEVKKPFGRVVGGEECLKAAKVAPRPLIAVGDRCGHDLITAGIAPDIIIFDFKIKRKEIPQEMKRAFAPHASNAYVVLSPAGYISEKLEEAVDAVLYEAKGAIFVVGEDDLSSLLVMAKAERGTLIYGQPDEGVVMVELGGRQVRQKALGFIGRMEKIVEIGD
jgi:uncharacterized protein (UPF0218 family)